MYGLGCLLFSLQLGFRGNMKECLGECVHLRAKLQERVRRRESRRSCSRVKRAASQLPYYLPRMTVNSFFWTISTCRDWSWVRPVEKTGAANSRKLLTCVWKTLRSWSWDPPRDLNLIRIQSLAVALSVISFTWELQLSLFERMT